MKKLLFIPLLLLLACHPIKTAAVSLDAQFKETVSIENKLTNWVSKQSDTCLKQAQAIKKTDSARALPYYQDCIKNPFELATIAANLIESIRLTTKANAQLILDVCNKKKPVSALGDIDKTTIDSLSKLEIILLEIN